MSVAQKGGRTAVNLSGRDSGLSVRLRAQPRILQYKRALHLNPTNVKAVARWVCDGIREMEAGNQVGQAAIGEFSWLRTIV